MCKYWKSPVIFFYPLESEYQYKMLSVWRRKKNRQKTVLLEKETKSYFFSRNEYITKITLQKKNVIEK